VPDGALILLVTAIIFLLVWDVILLTRSKGRPFSSGDPTFEFTVDECCACPDCDCADWDCKCACHPKPKES
jgi:hypothetical protein